MKAVEKQNRGKRSEIVANESNIYADAIVDLLGRITRDDVVKYILSLFGEFALDIPSFTQRILSKDEAYQVLLKLLDKNDEQIYLLVIKILVLLFNIQPASQTYVSTLFSHLAAKLLASPNVNLQDVAVQSYEILLQKKWYRSYFWQLNSRIVPTLLKVLKSSTGSLQLQYHTLLIFWLITFEKHIARELISEYEIVPMFLDIAKNSVKEKIIRVAVATLMNTVNLAPHFTISQLLSHSALPLVKTLSERKWADEELIEDLNSLDQTLQQTFDSMSTFDEYKSEILSKKLKWSPPHKSDLFWKDNVAKFKEIDWKMLKLLSEIVGTSQDNVSLAVSCNDISQIISLLPESIKILEKAGTKLKIMELMNHGDSEVRYESLKATQNFIAHSFN